MKRKPGGYFLLKPEEDGNGSEYISYLCGEK